MKKEINEKDKKTNEKEEEIKFEKSLFLFNQLQTEIPEDKKVCEAIQLLLLHGIIAPQEVQKIKKLLDEKKITAEKILVKEMPDISENIFNSDAQKILDRVKNLLRKYKVRIVGENQSEGIIEEKEEKFEFGGMSSENSVSQFSKETVLKIEDMFFAIDSAIKLVPENPKYYVQKAKFLTYLLEQGFYQGDGHDLKEKEAIKCFDSAIGLEAKAIQKAERLLKKIKAYFKLNNPFKALECINIELQRRALWEKNNRQFHSDRWMNCAKERFNRNNQKMLEHKQKALNRITENWEKYKKHDEVLLGLQENFKKALSEEIHSGDGQDSVKELSEKTVTLEDIKDSQTKKELINLGNELKIKVKFDSDLAEKEAENERLEEEIEEIKKEQKIPCNYDGDHLKIFNMGDPSSIYLFLKGGNDQEDKIEKIKNVLSKIDLKGVEKVKLDGNSWDEDIFCSVLAILLEHPMIEHIDLNGKLPLKNPKKIMELLSENKNKNLILCDDYCSYVNMGYDPVEKIWISLGEQENKIKALNKSSLSLNNEGSQPKNHSFFKPDEKNNIKKLEKQQERVFHKMRTECEKNEEKEKIKKEIEEETKNKINKIKKIKEKQNKTKDLVEKLVHSTTICGETLKVDLTGLSFHDSVNEKNSSLFIKETSIADKMERQLRFLLAKNEKIRNQLNHMSTLRLDRKVFRLGDTKCEEELIILDSLKKVLDGSGYYTRHDLTHIDLSNSYITGSQSLVFFERVFDHFLGLKNITLKFDNTFPFDYLIDMIQIEGELKYCHTVLNIVIPPNLGGMENEKLEQIKNIAKTKKVDVNFVFSSELKKEETEEINIGDAIDAVKEKAFSLLDNETTLFLKGLGHETEKIDYIDWSKIKKLKIAVFDDGDHYQLLEDIFAIISEHPTIMEIDMCEENTFKKDELELIIRKLESSQNYNSLIISNFKYDYDPKSSALKCAPDHYDKFITGNIVYNDSEDYWRKWVYTGELCRRIESLKLDYANEIKQEIESQGNVLGKLFFRAKIVFFPVMTSLGIKKEFLEGRLEYLNKKLKNVREQIKKHQEKVQQELNQKQIEKKTPPLFDCTIKIKNSTDDNKEDDNKNYKN